MPYYNSNAGISLALQSASSTFYALTDHNRQPMAFDYDVVEKASRMADGTMRKFVIARKRKVGVSWNDLPSGTFQPNNGTSQGYTMTVDGNFGGAWIKNFYETNMFKPIYVKITHSQDSASATSSTTFYSSPSASGSEYMWAFISNFSYEVTKRFEFTDLVNVKIDFTEI
jgi:hypothetical protein